MTAIVALLVIGGLIAVVLWSPGSPEPEDALEEFLTAYERRDYAAAAALTDASVPPQEQVAENLDANVIGLDGATLDAEVVSVEEAGGFAEATVRMGWEVPGIGPFTYENPEVELNRETVAGDTRWEVHWDPTLVHPDLDSSASRLGTTREFRDRAAILDRDGSALVIPRPVVEVGIVRGRLDDGEVERAVEAIAAATEANAKTLRASLEAAAGRQSFVPAITLREEDFAEIRDELDPIPGVEFGSRELPLAPTKEFARALLGTVGAVTAEQLDELGEPYAVGDNVGQGGLQLAYEQRLAGTPDRAVITRLADGTPAETLYEVEGERGRPLRTTLDGAVQTAAEEALGDGEDDGDGDVIALAAVDPGSGDVLAAATRPVDDSFNRAFEGQYPPGSTFKVITTEALLGAGLDPDETVACPPTIVAGGREFRNFEGGAAGPVPFRVDFAESCNTAFVSLAGRLEFGDLRNTAKAFGIGGKYELGVPTFAGDVPVSRDETEQAASMIGQGRTLVSPVLMAGVAATVIAGRWHAPRVLASDPREAGPRLPAGHVRELRSMMREVVTKGTGTALADLEGAPIGKSGTAEYGSGDPPPTHAWFIAARDDVAVAVLVEDRPSGGEFAAPIVARFFEALG